MKIVVPLAGPDFIQSDGSLKAYIDLKGEPLLRFVLQSRPWFGIFPPEDYIFVLQDEPAIREFVDTDLKKWFPGSKTVYLSDYTRGAALSAAAGVTLLKDVNEPIIIDLADIVYKCDINPVELLGGVENCTSIALTFESSNPIYSYLKKDDLGNFLNAAEKSVISKDASAGTYIFSSPSIFFHALGHALENEATQAYKKLFYVCPLLNGVKNSGGRVLGVSVHDVFDIKNI